MFNDIDLIEKISSHPIFENWRTECARKSLKNREGLPIIEFAK